MNKIRDMLEVFRQGILQKKFYIPFQLKLFGGLTIGAWLLVLILFLSSNRGEGIHITEAFAEAPDGKTESILEYTAFYGTKYMTQLDKINLLRYVAEGFGLEVDENITVKQNTERFEATFEKQSKRSDASVKVITTKENEQYIVVRLKIEDDEKDDILEYKQILEEVFTELKTENQYATLQIARYYTGHMEELEKNQLATQLIDQFEAEVAYENKGEGQFAVYAYSAEIPEYVKIGSSKINLQVAVRYAEDTNETIVYAATPLLRSDW